MTITYKAEVITIPENIDEILGIEVYSNTIMDSKFYNDGVYKCINDQLKRPIKIGSTNYDNTYEYAIFDTLSDALNFEKQLTEFAKELLKEIPKIMKESENL